MAIFNSYVSLPEGTTLINYISIIRKAGGRPPRKNFPPLVLRAPTDQKMTMCW